MDFDTARYVDLKYYQDERGYFFENNNLNFDFLSGYSYKQTNTSVNKNRVLRGMHYQHKNPQGKLCFVTKGKAVDFVIDLRKKSDTYLDVSIFNLVEKESAVWVPPGYAHGFFTMEEDTIFTYHVFNNGWCQGDEEIINPVSVPELEELLTNNSPIIVSPKDMDGWNFSTDLFPVYE